MLEPTKEPVKPVSAAEMITSIGQVPVEDASCPPDSVQVGVRRLRPPQQTAGGDIIPVLPMLDPPSFVPAGGTPPHPVRLEQ